MAGVSSSAAARICSGEKTELSYFTLEAIKNALRNFKANKCGINIVPRDFKNARENRACDFVCANILAKDILGFKELMRSCVSPKGYLAVSGIWKDDHAKFKKLMASKDFKITKESKSKGWHSLLYRRIS